MESLLICDDWRSPARVQYPQRTLVHPLAIASDDAENDSGNRVRQQTPARSRSTGVSFIKKDGDISSTALQSIKSDNSSDVGPTNKTQKPAHVHADGSSTKNASIDARSNGNIQSNEEPLRLGARSGEAKTTSNQGSIRSWFVESWQRLGAALFASASHGNHNSLDLILDTCILSNPTCLADGFMVSDVISGGTKRGRLMFTLADLPAGRAVFSEKGTRIERRNDGRTDQAMPGGISKCFLLIGSGRVAIPIDSRTAATRARFDNDEPNMRGVFTASVAAVALEFFTRRRLDMGVKLFDMTESNAADCTTAFMIHGIHELRPNHVYTCMYSDGHAQLRVLDRQSAQFRNYAALCRTVSRDDLVEFEFRSCTNVGRVVGDDAIAGVRNAFAGSPLGKPRRLAVGGKRMHGFGQAVSPSVAAATGTLTTSLLLGSDIPSGGVLTPPMTPDAGGWDVAFGFTPIKTPSGNCLTSNVATRASHSDGATMAAQVQRTMAFDELPTAKKTVRFDEISTEGADGLAADDAESVGPAPPPPPAPPTPPGEKKARTPRAKRTQSLRWTPVPKHKLRRTFWGDSSRTMPAGMSEADLDDVVNSADLESVFSLSPVQAKAALEKNGQGKDASCADANAIVRLLDLQRANTVSIFLAATKLTAEKICIGLLECDVEALGGTDRLPSLLSILPSTEELALVRQWHLAQPAGATGSKSRLGGAEQLFLELSSVTCTHERVRYLMMKAHAEAAFDELEGFVRSFEHATEEVRQSDKFGQILKLVLTLGSVLNSGTYLHSNGFKIESLNRLVDTKSKDRKTTLLDYLVRLVAEKLPSAGEFVEEIGCVHAAAQVDITYLRTETTLLQEAAKKLSTFELPDSAPTDALPQLIADLRVTVLPRSEALSTRVRSAIDRFTEVATYFGEERPSASTAQAFFANIDSFATSFTAAAQRHSERSTQAASNRSDKSDKSDKTSR